MVEPKKKKITFKNKNIFGAHFTPGVKETHSRVVSLKVNRHLRKNGDIKPKSETKVLKADLWSYIYYLWWNYYE